MLHSTSLLTCIVYRKDETSIQRWNDSVSVKCSIVFKKLHWTGPVDPHVHGLKVPDLGIMLALVGRLLGMKEVEDLSLGVIEEDWVLV